MKRINQTSGKGFLEINWAAGTATLTAVTKEEVFVYDFFAELEKFNNTNINFSVKEENEIKSIDGA